MSRARLTADVMRSSRTMLTLLLPPNGRQRARGGKTSAERLFSIAKHRNHGGRNCLGSRLRTALTCRSSLLQHRRLRFSVPQHPQSLTLCSDADYSRWILCLVDCGKHDQKTSEFGWISCLPTMSIAQRPVNSAAGVAPTTAFRFKLFQNGRKQFSSSNIRIYTFFTCKFTSIRVLL